MNFKITALFPSKRFYKPVAALFLLCSTAAIHPLSAQELYVGSNSSSQSKSFTSGVNDFSDTYVGYFTGDAKNLISVGGVGTLLSNSSSLSIGYFGASNSLVITNGGSVISPVTYVGYGNSSSLNSVLLTGAHSVLNTTGSLYLGYFGNSNSLVISNGGSVQAVTSIVGFGGSGNSVLVTGNGSAWTNSGVLTVGGYTANNSLVISNGGVVSAPVLAVLGAGTASTGNSLLVTGSGSLLSGASNGVVTIGDEGSGALTVANGGAVKAGTIIIASSNSSTASLNIGSLGGKDAAGTISSSSIVFGNGAGTLNFNQTNSTTLAAPIEGSGSIHQFGAGTTILTGANTYTGGTTISLGNLSANSLGDGSLTLNPPAGKAASFTDTLGSGILSLGALTLDGNSTINFANLYGAISSGTSTLAIDGSNNFISLAGAWTLNGTYSLLSGKQLTGSGLDSLELTGSLLGGGTLGLGKSVAYDGHEYTFTTNTTSVELIIASQKSFPFDESLQVVKVQAVPEPSTFALLGFGSMLVFIAYRSGRDWKKTAE